MSSPRTPPASAGKRSRVARRASSRGAGKGSDAPTRAARTPTRALRPGTHPEADAAFAERAVHLFALELEGHVLAMVEASRARQSLDAAMRVRPRATLFKTPLQLRLKIREEIFTYRKKPPGPGLRSRSLPPLLPQDERELADASCDAFHASASASRLAADASAAARRGSPITRGASASLRKRRDALAAADAARARLAVATARRRALRDAVDAAEARRAAYDDRDYARDALRRAVREESEATGRTPLPRGARAREATNDGGDGAREEGSADASPRSAGSSPEEAPAAKRAMTTAGEDEAAGEVDSLAEAFAAAACIR